MSKKKSTIIDDDPLAWLRDEPAETTAEDILVGSQGQTESPESASAEILASEEELEDKQESDSHVAEQIAEQVDEKAASDNTEPEINNNEKNFSQEEIQEVDSHEQDLLTARETETEVSLDTENENESQSCSDDVSQIMAGEEDEQAKEPSLLSENNEEDVAMATTNSEKIVLEEDVSIVQVAVLKEAWLPVLDSGKDIDINAAAVEDIDTAGLQLLLSLVTTAKESGRSVNWDNPSEAVINAVKETSLRDALGISL